SSVSSGAAQTGSPKFGSRTAVTTSSGSSVVWSTGCFGDTGDCFGVTEPLGFCCCTGACGGIAAIGFEIGWLAGSAVICGGTACGAACDDAAALGGIGVGIPMGFCPFDFASNAFTMLTRGSGGTKGFFR